MITIKHTLNFKPSCMATTLSTVPFRDPHLACRTMLEYFPEAPCVPKLSLSLRRYIDGMPCLLIDPEKRRITYDLSLQNQLQTFYERYMAGDLEYFAINAEYSPGFYTFLDIMQTAPLVDVKMIHIGLPGPLTWGLSLIDNKTGKPAWYDPIMREVLLITLTEKARWQKKKIEEVLPDIPVVVSFGEPLLSAIDSPFGSVSVEEVTETFNDLLNGIDCAGEIHCCSNMDWAKLLRTRTNVINFDAYQFADKIALYPAELSDFINRGGMLAWGIVPVNPEVLSAEDYQSLLD
ncbi:MAG: hypothetical protein ACE5DO_07270, partial [Desulfobacterales bacterium]